MSNQLTIKNLGSRFWFEISDWFTPALNLNEDSFISRLRTFQINTFTFLFVAAFINFLVSEELNYFIISLACLGLLAVRYLLDSNRVKAAYFLMLFSVNAVLILLTKIEGLGSGIFLFFFPSLLSFGFLTDYTNKKNVIFTYLTGASSFITAFSIAPDSILFGGAITKLDGYNFNVNVLLSSLMIVWISFYIAKENFRKQAILRNKEVFMNTVFNYSQHTTIIVDMKTGCIISYNQPASTLFAVPENMNLINMQALSLFSDSKDENKKQFEQEMNNTDCNWEGELTCKRQDGSEFPAGVSVISFKFHNNYYKKVSIVDITEKNQILSELQAAKNKAEELALNKSQFLSHMSHELRTPLNGIIGSTNLLLQDNILPGQKDQLSILKFSSEHMLSLINDILDLSKMEANRIQLEKVQIEIPDLIHKIAYPFVPQLERKGVAFEVEVDSNLKNSVLGDPTRINQVLTNLLSNALKFTNKGSVKLNVKASSIKSDYNTIEFSISDTGIGIPKDKLNHIFEQFSQADVKTTRKYGGTGLGLTISRKLVELMGGELKVESKFNQGSRFYFEISMPVHYSQKKLKVGEEVSIIDDQKLNGIKVLIAEDNPINMKIASRFLDKWGIVYEKASNGLEAVSLFKNNEFDLVLMDLEMPEMDGFGALKAIREMNSNIPAIAFTAAVFDNMKESLINKGFNDYIQKPFRPQDLQFKLIQFSEGLEKGLEMSA